MKPHHESNLEAAAAAVHEWQAKIRTITQNIEEAEAVVAASARRRAEHVLAASLVDDAARKHLDHVLQDDRQAESNLEDLRLALPLAVSELRTAEAAHRIAETEWRKAEVDRLARERVEAAAEIDRAFADFSAAWSRYESLGADLLDLASQEQNSNALWLSETVDGVGRLVASLPAVPFLQIKERYPFMPISTSKSLATAEAAYWRLPTVAEDKAA
jgi:hypothetical protein